MFTACVEWEASVAEGVWRFWDTRGSTWRQHTWFGCSDSLAFLSVRRSAAHGCALTFPLFSAYRPTSSSSIVSRYFIMNAVTDGPVLYLLSAMQLSL